MNIRDILQDNEELDYKTVLKHFTCDKAEESCWLHDELPKLYEECVDCKMKITALEDQLFCLIEIFCKFLSFFTFSGGKKNLLAKTIKHNLGNIFGSGCIVFPNLGGGSVR